VAAVARAEVQGFVGRSYSDFDPLEGRLDPSDPVDQEVLRVHPASFRFTVRTQTRNAVPEVRRLLQTWLTLRSRRPVRTLARGSSLADHLYGFEEALRLERWASAEEWLRRLEQSGLLSEENICGLEILLDDARDHSKAAWENRGFDRLVAKGPPRRVQFAMLRSGYRNLLAHHESSGDGAAALQTFRISILPRVRPLLSASVGVTSYEAAILLFLGHLLSEAPDTGLVSTAALRAQELSADPQWLTLLRAASGVELTPERDPVAGDLDAAMRAFNRNQLDLAWSLAAAAQPSWDRTVLLLRTAREADSLAWAGKAVEAFRFASETLTTTAEYAFARTILHALERRFQEADAPAVEPLPSGWLEWASRMGRSGAWHSAVRLAEAGMVEWSTSGLADGELPLFAETLGLVDNDNAPVLRRAIPYVLGALTTFPSNEPGLGEVMDTLLHVTLVDDSPGETFFPSLTDLLERRLRFGVSDTRYQALLRDIRDAVSLHGSQEALDALVDLFDVLKRHRCPHPAERAAVGTAIVAVAGESLHKMDLTQLVLIRELTRTLGIQLDGLADRIESVQSGAPDERPQVRSLAKLSVALYSLELGALQRAKQVLESAIPGLEVQVTDDKVSNDALVATAKSADLFVVAHRSAKHAATDAIRAARSSNLVYAEGKGSSSLIRAVFEWASKDTAA
jgi:hypothetical protein